MVLVNETETVKLFVFISIAVYVSLCVFTLLENIVLF